MSKKKGVDFSKLKYQTTIKDKDCEIRLFTDESITEEEYNRKIEQYYKTKYKLK